MGNQESLRIGYANTRRSKAFKTAYRVKWKTKSRLVA